MNTPVTLSPRRARGVRDSGGAGGRLGRFFIAAASAAIVCAAAWRADTETVLAFELRAAPGVAPASPREPIPGATTGFDGAILSAPGCEAPGGAADVGCRAGGVALCAATGAVVSATALATIHAATNVRIYFFAAGVAEAGALATGGAGGGGTGSENITRPLTSS